MRTTTATLHVHPACASNRELIEGLQAKTGLLVIVTDGKPKLQRRQAPATPSNPWGGDAA